MNRSCVDRLQANARHINPRHIVGALSAVCSVGLPPAATSRSSTRIHGTSVDRCHLDPGFLHLCAACCAGLRRFVEPERVKSRAVAVACAHAWHRPVCRAGRLASLRPWFWPRRRGCCVHRGFCCCMGHPARGCDPVGACGSLLPACTTPQALNDGVRKPGLDVVVPVVRPRSKVRWLRQRILRTPSTPRRHCTGAQSACARPPVGTHFALYANASARVTDTRARVMNTAHASVPRQTPVTSISLHQLHSDNCTPSITRRQLHSSNRASSVSPISALWSPAVALAGLAASGIHKLLPPLDSLLLALFQSLAV